MRPRILTLALLGLLAACGARTTLRVDDSTEPPGGLGGGGGQGGSAGAAGQPADGGAGAKPDGAAGLDAGVDADADAGPDADADVIVTDAGCEKVADCDDEVECTDDACSEGVCTHTPLDTLCDDGLFCTGVERCDAVKGCVTTPLNCADSVGCTVDGCDEGQKACTHQPDDALCPLSHKCGLTEGCYALAYAHTEDALYEIRLPSGKVTEIGVVGTQLTDIALASNTQLYGLSYSSLYLLNTSNGEATYLSDASASGMVAFDVAPDGKLYVGGGEALYLLDVASGNTSFAASYPQGYQASGDLAFLQGRLLATARTQFDGEDVLVEFDLNTGGSKLLGATGFDCIWGLAAFGETLYGLTCNGQVLSVNPATGSSKALSSGGPAFWGASAR